MLGVDLSEKLIQIEFSSQACIKLLDADFDLRPQLFKIANAFEHFQAELLLRCLRQGGGLRECQLQCFTHSCKIAEMPEISSWLTAIVWKNCLL